MDSHCSTFDGGAWTIATIIEEETEWPANGCVEITPIYGTNEFEFSYSIARIPGDANDDRMVDIFDALLILQYDVGWAVVINESNAEVDGNGMVNIFDALLVLQYDVGWDVTLQ